MGLRGTGALLAAVSGGADSVSMLAALTMLRGDVYDTLRCVHVDHALRGEESQRDARFVVSLCKRLKVPCKVYRVRRGAIETRAKRIGCGIEAAARDIRYKALKKEAARCGAAFILTAHTRDDALETILMRFLRGAGAAGLALMPVRRNHFLRPLLAVGRAEILAYLQEKKLTYITDSSNNDTYYLRNRVRHVLVPVLNSAFPGWRRGVLSGAQTQSLIASFLQEETERQKRERPFFDLPQILREEVLFHDLDAITSVREQNKKDALPDPLPKGGATIRRESVRRFCAGTVRKADLGPAIAEALPDGSIETYAKPPSISQRGSFILRSLE
jgi:tRNA(Ile)-lysidine synthase